MFKRIIAGAIIFCLVFEQIGFAQVVTPKQLSLPGYLNAVEPVLDKFRPVQLRSIETSGDNKINLLLDKGDSSKLQARELNSSADALIEYLQIGLRLPNSIFWVNLRPDAPNSIIDPLLEKTDMGKVFLETDVQLKKDLARFTDPATKEGRQYWDKLYQKVEELFGQQDAEIPTITRPWIVPGEIILNRAAGRIDIYKATLEVMLEQDYIGKQASGGYPGGIALPVYDNADPRFQTLNAYSTQLIRELIIPKLTREVNSSKRYAAFRQVYYSLIFAQYLKSSVKQSGASFLSEAVDNGDLSGLTSRKQWSKDKYFREYSRSLSQGEYSKEETVTGPGGQIVRQYVSGGISMGEVGKDGAGITVLNNLPAVEGTVSVPLEVNRDGGILSRLGVKRESLLVDNGRGRDALPGVIEIKGDNIISVSVGDETRMGVINRFVSRLNKNANTSFNKVSVGDILTKGHRSYKVSSIVNTQRIGDKKGVIVEVKLAEIDRDGVEQAGPVVQLGDIFDNYQFDLEATQAAMSAEEKARAEAENRAKNEAIEKAKAEKEQAKAEKAKAKADQEKARAEKARAEKAAAKAQKENANLTKDNADKSKILKAISNSKWMIASAGVPAIVFGAAAVIAVGSVAAILATVPVFFLAGVVPIVITKILEEYGKVDKADVPGWATGLILTGVLALSFMTFFGLFDPISLGLTWHQTAEFFFGSAPGFTIYLQAGIIGLLGATYIGWNLSAIGESSISRFAIPGVAIVIGTVGIIAASVFGVPFLIVPSILLMIEAGAFGSGMFGGLLESRQIAEKKPVEDPQPSTPEIIETPAVPAAPDVDETPAAETPTDHAEEAPLLRNDLDAGPAVTATQEDAAETAQQDEEIAEPEKIVSNNLDDEFLRGKIIDLKFVAELQKVIEILKQKSEKTDNENEQLDSLEMIVKQTIQNYENNVPLTSGIRASIQQAVMYYRENGMIKDDPEALGLDESVKRDLQRLQSLIKQLIVDLNQVRTLEISDPSYETDLQKIRIQVNETWADFENIKETYGLDEALFLTQEIDAKLSALSEGLMSAERELERVRSASATSIPQAVASENAEIVETEDAVIVEPSQSSDDADLARDGSVADIKVGKVYAWGTLDSRSTKALDADSLEVVDPAVVKNLNTNELLSLMYFDKAQQVWKLTGFNVESAEVTLSLYGTTNENYEGYGGIHEKRLKLQVLIDNGKLVMQKDGGTQAPGGNLGGIDMRSLPAITLPALSGKVVTPRLVSAELKQLAARSQIKDLGKEWSALDRQIKTGKNVPYDRIKEFYAVCSCSKDGEQFRKLILGYVQTILRAEEDLAMRTDAGMTTLLRTL